MVLELRKDIQDGEKSEYLIIDFNRKVYFDKYLTYLEKAYSRKDFIDSVIYLDQDQNLTEIKYTLVNNGFIYQEN